MKMSQAKLREVCECLRNVEGSDKVEFGSIIVRLAGSRTGVSLGNIRVIVFKNNDMIARGRFNDLSKFILHEIKAQADAVAIAKAVTKELSK